MVQLLACSHKLFFRVGYLKVGVRGKKAGSRHLEFHKTDIPPEVQTDQGYLWDTLVEGLMFQRLVNVIVRCAMFRADLQICVALYGCMSNTSTNRKRTGNGDTA